MKIGIRILQYRTPTGAGFADAFFTTQLGVEDDEGNYTALVDIRDCELRTAQSGEHYVKFPSKPRIRKTDSNTATYLKDAAGKVIYDSIVDSPREKVGEEYFPTDASKKFKDKILQLVMNQNKGQRAEASGRGSGTRTAQARPAVAANTGTTERGNPLAQNDNDLPF